MRPLGEPRSALIGRRSLVLGLAALGVGCSGRRSDEAGASTTPGSGEPALLVVAQWDGMMYSSSLAVYDGGLLDHRSSGMSTQDYRVAIAAPEPLEALRVDLASTGFARAKSFYEERDVMDGAALTIAGVVSERRILVINQPEALPAELRRVVESLDTLERWILRHGKDPFLDEDAPAQGRMLLEHQHRRAASEDARTLAVFDRGVIELRTTEERERFSRRRDSSTPRSIVRVLEPDALAGLREALERLRSSGVKSSYGSWENEGDEHFLALAGEPSRISIAPGEPVPEVLQGVLECSAELARGLEP